MTGRRERVASALASRAERAATKSVTNVVARVEGER
jgi:hypothetical protein